MARLLITAMLLLVLATPVALAGAEVTLKGGRVLKGSEVKKEEGFYNLLMEDGNLLSIPVELVESIELVEGTAREGTISNQVRSGSSGGSSDPRSPGGLASSSGTPACAGPPSN